MLQKIQRATSRPQFIHLLFVVIIALLLLAGISRAVLAEDDKHASAASAHENTTITTAIGSNGDDLSNTRYASRIGAFRVPQDDAPSVPDFQGIIVDDVSDSFILQGPNRYWHEASAGYLNHLWWTKNNDIGIENSGSWNLGIRQSGTYQITVYIPVEHATTRQAHYYVHHQGQTTEIIVNQRLNQNDWYTLGSFEFSGDGEEFLELTDETGELDSQYEVAFDAVGFVRDEPGLEDQVAEALWDRVKIWLDDQATELNVHLDEWLERQKGELLRQLGNTLTSWIDEQCTGLGAAILLPGYALISSRKRQRDG